MSQKEEQVDLGVLLDSLSDKDVKRLERLVQLEIEERGLEDNNDNYVRSFESGRPGHW